MGTGLGLTNARKVIELHEGTIHIDSRTSEGTTITIELAYDPTDNEESDLDEVKQEAT